VVVDVVLVLDFDFDFDRRLGLGRGPRPGPHPDLDLDPDRNLDLDRDPDRGREDDVAFATKLVVKHGVATVPVSSVFAERDPSRRMVRFAFCKTDDVLVEAGRRLEAIRR
jgi:aspartate/methionine/tyrosine aminotransferase